MVLVDAAELDKCITATPDGELVALFIVGNFSASQKGVGLGRLQ